MKLISKFRIQLTFLGTIVGLGLFFFQLYLGIKSSFSLDIASVNYRYIWFGIFIIGLTIKLNIDAWLVMVKNSGIKVPYLDAHRLYILSFLPRYIPGTIWGYLTRGEVLYQRYRLSTKVSAVISVIEIAYGLTSGLMIIILWGLLITNNWWLRALLFLFLALPVIVYFIIRYILGNPRVKNFLFYSSGDDFYRLTFRSWITSIGILVINWFFYGLMLMACLRFMGFNNLTNNLIYEVVESTAVFSAAWMVGFFIFFIPSGMGVRELTLTSLLVMISGIDLAQASAVSILSRLIILIAEFCWICISIILQTGINFRAQKKPSDDR